MANLITLGRLVLFFVTLGLIYSRQATLIQIATILLIVVIASDALDGWVARRQGNTSDFGSVIDIAGDRVVEQCSWVVFAHLGLIGVWIPLLAITRGILVDTLRAVAFRDGRTAFGPKTMARGLWRRQGVGVRLPRRVGRGCGDRAACGIVLHRRAALVLRVALRLWLGGADDRARRAGPGRFVGVHDR